MRKRTTIGFFPKKDKIHIFFFKGKWRLSSLFDNEPDPDHAEAAIRFCMRVNGEQFILKHTS